MKKIFILDDNFLRQKWFKEELNKFFQIITAEDLENAKEIFIKNGPFDFLFLDHDLGSCRCLEKGDGLKFSQWLLKNCNYKPKIIIHSENKYKLIDMFNILENNFETKRLKYSDFQYKWLDGSLTIEGCNRFS